MANKFETEIIKRTKAVLASYELLAQNETLVWNNPTQTLEIAAKLVMQEVELQESRLE